MPQIYSTHEAKEWRYLSSNSISHWLRVASGRAEGREGSSIQREDSGRVAGAGSWKLGSMDGHGKCQGDMSGASTASATPFFSQVIFIIR